jgi:hypothetical protein
MAHYAFLDENNVVTEVIVGNSEGGLIDWESHYSAFRGQPCKRTSYNTVGGVHLAGGTPYRKNYAGPGYVYDSGRDAFIAPKPHASWILDENTCRWEAPIAIPTEGGPYQWDEATASWIAIAA